MKQLIGLCGVARSGKDTFYTLAKQYIENKLNLNCKKISFAEALREEVNDILIQNFNISAWTTDNNEKELIRDILVAWSKTRRNQNVNYWIEKVIKNIDKENVNIITDVRYKNEIDFIHKNNGVCIYLQRQFDYCLHGTVNVLQPCNDEERLHTVPLQDICDYSITWRDINVYRDECIKQVNNLISGLIYTDPPFTI